MAISGNAANGMWMQVVGYELNMGRMGMSVVVETDKERALDRLRRGEQVHVGMYGNMHIDIAEQIRAELAIELGGEEIMGWGT